jgi:hypothetical protein
VFFAAVDRISSESAAFQLAGRVLLDVIMDDDPRQLPRRRDRAENPDGDVLAPRGECASELASSGSSEGGAPARFEPPVSALGQLFSYRLQKIHACRVPPRVHVSSRPTRNVLGGYYKSRRLVRVYSHDTVEGRRPLEELFGTFLHEVAHHLEYTEPQNFGARRCRRVYGLMHSRLFWRILGELKWRWAQLEARSRS